MSIDPSTPAPPGAPPTPTGVNTLDDLVARLAELREWAGQPSFTEIAERVGRDRAARGVPAAAQRLSRSTVWDLFRPGRNRLDASLLIEVVRALGVDATGAAAWRHAYGNTAAGSNEVRRLVAIADTIPKPTDDFTARESLAAELAAAPAGTTLALAGMAGVGKSQLALQIAARRAAPGATIFVPLGGGDRRQLPVDAASLLRDLLVFVGVTPRRLGGLGVAEQQDLWAAWIAEHRAVVVLDDAFDAGQIGAVVAPRHGGFVVVTSRALLDLPHATTVMVEPFSASDSIGFLRRSIAAPAPGDEQRLARIGELCGGVPLELSVAAARIAEQPDWSLDDHLRRFERMPVGRTLSASLAATTESLGDDLHLVFRRLALHPGSRISLWSLAALCGLTTEATAGHIGSLAALSLVRPLERDPWPAFEIHDLVREHAAELLHERDPYTAQAEAVSRLCGEAQRLLAVAAPVALPVARAEPVDGRPLDELAASLTDGDTARAWIGAEALTLVELVDLAVTFDLHVAAGELFLPVVRHLDVTGRWELAIKTGQRVLSNPDPGVRARAWRSMALVLIRQARYDEAVEALGHARDNPDATDADVELIHTLLGGVYAGIGRLHEALGEHQRALAIAEASGDPVRLGRAYGNLGNRLRELGDLHGAEQTLRRAIDFDRHGDDPFGLMMGHGNLGLVLEDQHRDDEALALLGEALRIADELGTKIMHPLALVVIGRIHGRRGDRAAWRDHVERGMAVAREIGADSEVGEALGELGEMALLDGDGATARAHFEQVLQIATEGNDRKSLINAVNRLGDVALAAGDPGAAVEHHRDALAMAESSGYTLERARAHRGLGRAFRAAGNPAASEHRQAAERLFDQLGVPEAGL